MAQATRNTKQQKTASATATTEKQLPRGETKPMKGFARYTFYKDGTVYNTATGNQILPSVKNGTAMQLTNDKGERKAVSIDEVKALFKVEAKVVKPAAPKPQAAAKKPATGEGRGKPKLDYEGAMAVRKRLAAGETRAAIAKDLDVDPWTIQSIAIGYTYKLKEGDKNPIPADMMRQFLSSNLPAAWKKNPPAGLVLPVKH